MVPANLALGASQYLPYPHQLIFPNLQRLTWCIHNVHQGHPPSNKGYWGLLLLLISPEQPLKELRLEGYLEAPVPFLTTLRRHVSPGLTSLSILCIQIPQPVVLSALAALVSKDVLPSLRSLRTSNQSYNFNALDRQAIVQIQRVHVQFSFPAGATVNLLPAPTAFIGMKGLCLEIPQAMIWQPSSLASLFSIKDLEELQLFSPPAQLRSTIMPFNITTMGSAWQNISVLNLANFFTASPAILDSISSAMPRIKRLALHFSSWVCGGTLQINPMSELEVLAFNLYDIPPHAMTELGFYLTFICPKTLKLATCVTGLAEGYDRAFDQIIPMSSQGSGGELVRMLAAIGMALAAASRRRGDH